MGEVIEGDAIRLSRFEESDRSEVIEFLRAVRSPAHAERLIRQWDWKLTPNPERKPYVLLLKDRGRVVGLEGAMQLRLSVNGRNVPAAVGCDLVVHPEYRGRGLSAGMMREYRRDHPVGVGWANSASMGASRRLENAGSRDMRIRPLVRPLAVGPVLTRVAHEPGAGWLRPLARSYRWLGGGAPQRAARRVRSPDGVRISRVTRFDERFDALWARVRKRHAVLVVRDCAYLNWRFCERPDASYTILVAEREEELLGYVVARAAERSGIRWGYLVDAVCPGSGPPLRALYREAIEHMRRDGAAAVSCVASEGSHRRLLARLGFALWCFGAPGYLRVRVDSPDPGLDPVRDFGSWFFTMGDADMEMAW